MQVGFDEKVYDQVTGMYSREKEYVAFEEPVMASGPVEIWLSHLVTAAHRSLNDVITNAAVQLAEPGIKIIDLLHKYPAQVNYNSSML